MSLLVDKQIKEAISKEEIIIDPYDPKAVRPAAYYFKLGKSLLIPKGKQLIKPDRGEDPKYEKRDISKAGYILKPKEFVLGQTLEVISIANNIAMFCDGRSTLARLGLSIHQSSTFIHPGHTNSIITLEIFNAGNFEIELKEGIDIAKGIFFRSSSFSDVAYKDSGIYPHQKEVMGADLPPYKNK